MDLPADSGNDPGKIQSALLGRADGRSRFEPRYGDQATAAVSGSGRRRFVASWTNFVSGPEWRARQHFQPSEYRTLRLQGIDSTPGDRQSQPGLRPAGSGG